MPPKKREKEGEGSKNGRVDLFQNDHELFLQAFEKPTQIYRYLRTRNMISPIFLNRTLTYMKTRSSRNNKGRASFKVDNLLSQKMNKLRNEKLNVSLLGDYMTLMFMGLYDKGCPADGQEHVKVETILLKISHKKRKDASALVQVNIGTSDVEVNPNENKNAGKVPAISIPPESFKPVGGSLNWSYILLLRVDTSSKSSPPVATTLPNGTTPTMNGDDDEPPANKKIKSKLYGSELVIFDKLGRCLLTEGEYILALEEIIQAPKLASPKKHANWETITDTSLDDIDKSCNPFETFDKLPTLKFRLVWTKERSDGTIDIPPPMPSIKSDSRPAAAVTDSNSNKENQPDEASQNTTTINHNNNKITTVATVGTTDVVVTPPGGANAGDEKLQIVYQFIYNNNSRQQTEACADFHCPWCSLNCIELYPLLKHLKLCHSRFQFTLTQIESGARIDVAINELYDGSYTGSPHDLVGQSGFAFSRTGPVRRTVVSHILVCRPRRPKPMLSEFAEIETEIDNQRPFITGHNRLYHHTVTCLPVHPKELDKDSEDESDPLWLQYKTMMMIDEFTDVNEGEKELMKMWNLHVMKHGYVGDCQISIACNMFLDQKGRELLEKNLYRNFLLHLCNLFDYGLLPPDEFYKTVQKLQKILSENIAAKQVMTETRSEQMEHWMKYGIHKQIQQQQLQLLAKKDAEEDDDEEDDEGTPKDGRKASVKAVEVVRDQKPSVTVLLSPANMKKISGMTATPVKPNEVISRRKSSIPKFQIPNEPNGSLKQRRLTQLKVSPPRRRSAGPLIVPDKSSEDKNGGGPTRRRSIAVTTNVNARKRKRECN